jgi:hypothetical protein
MATLTIERVPIELSGNHVSINDVMLEFSILQIYKILLLDIR